MVGARLQERNDLYRDDALRDAADLCHRRLREIEVYSGDVRASIVYPDDDGSPGLKVGDFEVRTEWVLIRRGGIAARIKDLARGRHTGALRAVVRRHLRRCILTNQNTHQGANERQSDNTVKHEPPSYVGCGTLTVATGRGQERRRRGGSIVGFNANPKGNETTRMIVGDLRFDLEEVSFLGKLPKEGGGEPEPVMLLHTLPNKVIWIKPEEYAAIAAAYDNYYAPEAQEVQSDDDKAG